MRAYVFTDAALARHAGRFVWLSVDTEKEQSAAFLARFPVESWPTLFVVDPRSEKAVLRWLGSATVPQLVKLLDDGEHAYRGDAQGPDGRLAQADTLYAAGKPAEAAKALQDLLAVAPPDWSRRSRAVESLLYALDGTQQHEACATTALKELPRLPRSASSANVAAVGLACALSGQGAPWTHDAVPALEAKAKDALGPPKIEMAADDVSGLYETLVSAREEAHDAAGQKALAQAWAAYLEGEAARAPNPEARAVFDPHRLSAYLALGEPARAVAMLQQSQRDLPGDYNPPARLAFVYRTLKRNDEALAANDQALARVYGPRKLRVLSERAEIFLARGDPAGARKTLQDALAFARSLSPAQLPRSAVPSLEKKLAKLPPAP